MTAGLTVRAQTGAATPAAATTYALPGAAVFPEGVAYQPSARAFFVGSTTDGTIFRGDTRTGQVSVFSPGGADGRTTAIGLKVDGRNRLWVSGGGTGRIWVYDARSGALLKALSTPAAPATFINDVVISNTGDAYFTDSLRPLLFKVEGTGGAIGEVEVWRDFTGTALQYAQGFNLNGIAATRDGRYLVVVQSNTGKLFRVDTRTKAVGEIALGGLTVTAGDGLLLDGFTLYVVRNAAGQIVPVVLNADLSAGQVGAGFTDPSLAFPTTIAKVGDRLLVVNSQFDKRGAGLTPAVPFTVSSIALP